MPRKAPWLLPLIAAMLLVLAGCAAEDDSGGVLSSANFHRIRPDMTGSEVMAILGEPTERSRPDRAGRSTWRWEEDERTIDVLFETDGRVASRGRLAVKYGYNLQ